MDTLKNLTSLVEQLENEIKEKSEWIKKLEDQYDHSVSIKKAQSDLKSLHRKLKEALNKISASDYYDAHDY